MASLYYENHRGTYTTQANNKRNNRKSELLYRDAELWSVFAAGRGGTYPAESLTDGWHAILLNQFHDILPGSSVNEVYRDCDQDYARILSTGEAVRTAAISQIAANADTRGDGAPVVVFNSLEWNRSDVVTIDSDRRERERARRGR